MEARSHLSAPPAAASPAAASLDHLFGLLHQQSGAVQQEQMDQAADLGEECVRLLRVLEPAPPGPEVLTRLRDLALYNQSLLRHSMTNWAAARLERARGPRGYSATGRVVPGRDLGAHTRGVL